MLLSEMAANISRLDMGKRKALIYGCIPLVIMALAALVWLKPILEDQYAKNNTCGPWIDERFISGDFYFWAESHDGWYPKGYPSSGAVFSILCEADAPPGVHPSIYLFSSRSDYAKAWKYYDEHHTLSDEVVFYRYNQGLHNRDPSDLILLYGKMASGWKFDLDKMDHVGRTIMNVGCEWEFLTEEEFAARQKKTLEFIAARVSAPKPVLPVP